MDRRISLEVDITNISDRDRRERIGDAMKLAWRLEDACKDLVSSLDLTTTTGIVASAKAYEALIKIQNIIIELRKQQ